jgi:hypothetical protein
VPLLGVLVDVFSNAGDRGHGMAFCIGRTAFRVAACAQRHGPGITNRETIARTARSDHSSYACKGHGPRKGDIRANSNVDAGDDLILTVE